jgi:hypothetical protein
MDVSQEIIDQEFNAPKVILFLIIIDVAVIAFAGLVVIPHHAASVGRVIMESILEAMRALRRRSRKLPQHHLPNGSVRVHKSGAKNELGGQRHMAS